MNFGGDTNTLAPKGPIPMRKKKQIELESGKRVSGPEFRGEKVAHRTGVWGRGQGR